MPVDGHAQVKAVVSKNLKLKTFSELALRDLRFNAWLQEQMRRWLKEIAAEERTTPLESREGAYAETP